MRWSAKRNLDIGNDFFFIGDSSMPDDKTGNTGGVEQGNQQQQQGQQGAKPVVAAPVATPVAVPVVPVVAPRETLNTEQKGLNPRDTLNTSQHNNQSEARRSLNIIQKGGK